MATDYCLICHKCKEKVHSTISTLFGIKYIEDFYRPDDDRLYNHDEEIKENIFYVNETELISEFLIKHLRCKVDIIDMDSMEEEIYNYNRFSPEKLHYKIELEDEVLEEYKNKVENRDTKITTEILDLEKTVELKRLKKHKLLNEKSTLIEKNNKLAEMIFDANNYDNFNKNNKKFYSLNQKILSLYEENVKLKSELIRLYKKQYLDTVIEEDKNEV